MTKPESRNRIQVELRRRQPRRGMAIVFVLSLLSIALAVSYTMLRTQMTSAQIKQNMSRQVDARQAAMTGMNTALRILHEDAWQGVDVPILRQLNSLESFEIKFQTGDASLLPTDKDYAEYPYRVTITSTGFAKDAVNPQICASHQVTAVVQLVRRAMAAPPTNWSGLQQHTIYQWADKTSVVQVPVRTEGPVRLMGRLDLCKDYPKDANSRLRYLSDLEAMRVAGSGDHRPFNGPLDLRYSINSSSTLKLLQDNLGLKTKDVSGSTSNPITHPGTVLTYQLYSGGKEYSIPKIQDYFGATLANIELKPDVMTNPLGIYRSYGQLSLKDNVKIEGTIIAYGDQADILILGDNVHFKSTRLPTLVDSSSAVELPVAIVGDDFRVYEESNAGSLTGLIVTWDDFEFKRGNSDVSFAVSGRVLTSELILDGRSAWSLGDSEWNNLLTDFLKQLRDVSIKNPVKHFPTWIEKQKGFVTKPLLTIKPQPDVVTYHWHDWNKPVFLPHADDDGLRWDLIDWQDVP